MIIKCVLLFHLFCVLEINCKLGNDVRRDYVYLNETRSFYKFHADRPYTWLHAKEACELEGATLFYPENEREVTTVIDYFSAPWTGDRIYVGLYKHNALRSLMIGTEGFTTMDGRALQDVYYKWSDDQPDNRAGVEHCVLMFKEGLYHDYSCLIAYYNVQFICKKTENNLSSQECKPGKFYVNDYTFLRETGNYYKFHDDTTPYSWLHAKAACELEGATLFYPENESETKTIIDHFSAKWTAEKIYVGIYKHNAILRQIDETEEFKTMDGRSFEGVFHKWERGEPNNGNGNGEHCICLNKNGLLQDYPCLQPYDDVQFICKTTEVNSYKDGKPEKFFRKDYKYLDSTQNFYKLHTINRSWLDAKTACELEGATLFYPQDEEEAKAVITFWNSTQSSFWIHVGICAFNARNVYETVDGILIEDVYHKWAPAEPTGYSEACVILRRDGLLTDDDCELTWPFICKKTQASLHWNDLCDIPDPEYTYNEKTGRCYKLHATPKTWSDAYVTCSMEGTRLAIINSDVEAQLLVNLIKTSNKDLIYGDFLRRAVHLGFKYDNGWKTYQGIDIKNSGYAKWGKGQPDASGDETCGSMFYDGLLSSVSCETKSFFVCAKSPTTR